MSEELKQEDIITEEEAARIESVFFEDDEQVMLRDGKTYKIMPSNLKNAMKLRKLLRSVSIDVIMSNFLESGNILEDEARLGSLFAILEIAFAPYKLSKDYLMEYIDLKLTSKIIEILVGLNGLKK